MLDKIFKQAGEKSLALDTETLRQHTDFRFVRIVEDKIAGQVIRNMRVNGDRRAGYLYFKIGSRQFSFAYDKIKRNLVFSEIVRGKWEFIVGFKEI